MEGDWQVKIKNKFRNYDILFVERKIYKLIWTKWNLINLFVTYIYVLFFASECKYFTHSYIQI